MQAIVDLVAPTSNDLVVEIGPGQGALTGELQRRAAHVIALEIDRDLVAHLRARFPDVEVVQADARAWPYKTLVAPPSGRVLVAGNLPYSASKPILMSLVAARTVVNRIVLMLQREVAERLVAGPGSKTYGALSVLTQLYGDVRLAFRVPAGAFRPPPKVESAVVRLDVLPEPRVTLADEHRFHVVVRAAFGQRRKTLANALASGLGVSVDKARNAATLAGIDPRRRAETLTIVEFARLVARLS